jgi:hypothetical protein
MTHHATNPKKRRLSDGEAFCLLVQAWSFGALMPYFLGMWGAMFFRYVSHKVHAPEGLCWAGLVIGGATGSGLGIAVVQETRRKIASRRL